MRYLVYLLTLFFIGTAIAQNPTIVQGDYITNVFGPSNFVKNPNAQINTANVTVSNATVTRGTTTPLVAKSEFTITTSTATGYADWDLRAFDAGMKNNNCEARFTYRGFTVGSTKAQILQGANVVAELTLVGDANNPKQASINFPCGDLSAVTKFRLQQASAALTGTNEIGGIYVGLATNMANVAQAEMVGTLRNYGPNCIWTGAGTSAMAADTDCSTYSKEGLDLQPSTRVPAITFTAPKSGNYAIGVHVYAGVPSVVTYQCQIYQNGVLKNNVISNYTSLAATQNENRGYVQFNADLTSGTSYTFDVRCTTSALLISRSVEESLYWTVYRFPSSSELVVTPERQNVFASVKASSSGGITPITSAAWTKITATGTLTRTNFGKTKVESNNDYSITIEKLPVGNYYVSVTAVLYAEASGSGNQTDCFFGTADTATGGAQIASMQVASTGDATKTDQLSFGSTFGGVYSNTSVADRTFFVQGYRANGAGRCLAYTDSSRPLTITVIPLDQPSNSALYVEGPVKAAATGAAIPTGFQNEFVQSVSSNLAVIAGSGGTVRTGTGITLQPGIWEIEVHNGAGTTAPNQVQAGITDTVNGSALNDSRGLNTTRYSFDAGNTCCVVYAVSRGIFRVTTAKTFYPLAVAYPAGSNFDYAFNITARRLN